MEDLTALSAEDQLPEWKALLMDDHSEHVQSDHLLQSRVCLNEGFLEKQMDEGLLLSRLPTHDLVELQIMHG